MPDFLFPAHMHCYIQSGKRQVEAGRFCYNTRRDDTQVHFMKKILFISLISLIFALPAQAQDAAGDLLGRINGLRASLGLAPYSLNGALSTAALRHAQWMSATGSVSHTGADGSTPRSRAVAAGYSSNWVSENIYIGSIATAADAWNFWVNSPIHYAGLTAGHYSDVGIGVSGGGNGTAFVLLFGNPAGIQSAPRPNNASGGNNTNQAAPAQPSFVLGLDEKGNIMHEIQEGDTLGDIALIYGYTWDDIPAMLELNGLTQEDIRLLQVGEVFLVPSWDGTFTPTPAPDQATATETIPATEPPAVTPSPTLTPSPTVLPSATLTPEISKTPAAIRVLMLPSASPPPTLESAATPSVGGEYRGPSLFLVAVVLLQMGIIAAAGFELIRRSRR